jgi:hypothetical protein
MTLGSMEMRMNSMTSRPRGFRLTMVALLWLGSSWPAKAGGLEAGRPVDSGRHNRTRVIVGSILNMEGFVEEATDAAYDAASQSFGNAGADGSGASDFDVNAGYALLGLGVETLWKYVGFRADFLGMKPKTDAVAQRSYLIEVGDVSYNGATYDSMVIPEGTAFTAELAGLLAQLDLVVTPVTINLGDSARVTPWVGVGLFAMFGAYDIDAGAARGVVRYPGVSGAFVVGGHGEGTLGGGLPEWLLGAELVLGAPDTLHVVLQGQVGLLAYDGSASYFTTSDTRVDNASIDHKHVRWRGFVEIPLGDDGFMMQAGAQFEAIDSKVEITSSPTVSGQSTAFDQAVDFTMTTATGFVGLVF